MSDATRPDPIVLVTGATGNQGGAVARHLLSRGRFSVRAMTRDPDGPEADALRERGAEVVEGDFEDPDSLRRAVDGAYGAYSVQNSWEAGVEAEVEQGVRFAEVVREAGIRHLVYSSVGGAERETGIPHFESKWEIERQIRRLDLPATILRPVYFMQNWELPDLRSSILSGNLPQPLSPETPFQQVSVGDIGAFAALAFEEPDRWTGKALELAGDELTMRDTARAFGDVLDGHVEYVQVPWGDFREQAGREMALMYRWFEEEGYRADIERLRRIHPGLTTFPRYLKESWAHLALEEAEPRRSPPPGPA